MAREYFVFNRNYYEIVKALDEKQRLEMYDAICEYALNQNESKIDGLSNALFSLIKPDILKGLKKYENGIKGGRGKKASGKQNESKTKANGKQTESKEETTFPLQKTTKEKVEQKEKNKKYNTPFVQEEYTPLFVSPQSGEKTNDFANKFFEKYPRYAKDRAKMRVDVDYERLLAEFEKSSWLRSLYTVKQINENYVGIIAGDYRDQEKQVDGITAGREYMAERERYYTALRAEEERKVEAIVKKLMTYPRYAEIDKRLRSIEIDSAKAELKGDKPKMAKLEMERQRLRMERNNILSNNGLEEEDITVKRHCNECNDTGWLEDGTMCTCYKGG